MNEIQTTIAEYVAMLGNSGIKLLLAIAIFAALQIPRWVISAFIRRAISMIDDDGDGDLDGGFVKIPEATENAINRASYWILQLIAIAQALRWSGLTENSEQLGFAGLLAFGLGFVFADRLSTLFGAIYALGNDQIQAGYYVEVSDASGFLRSIGIWRSELFDPITDDSTFVDSAAFLTDPTLKTSGKERTHIVNMECNPDEITAVKNVALSWAANNPVIARDDYNQPIANFIIKPGATLTGSGVPCTLTMLIEAQGEPDAYNYEPLFVRYGQSVRWATDNPLSEAIYKENLTLSVFDIGGSLQLMPPAS